MKNINSYKSKYVHFGIIAIIGIFWFDVARAMEDDPFSETDKHISIKPMEDKQLEESIKLHNPKFVTPSRWQSVEVLQPSKPWKAWKKERLNDGKPEYLAEECVDGKRRFVDKWIIPSSIWSPFMSSLVSFREDKTEAMLRQDAYNIMTYENEEITKLRKELYESEYFDFISQAGRSFDRREAKDATHPEIFEFLKEDDAKIKKKKQEEEERYGASRREEARRFATWQNRQLEEKAKREEEERKKQQEAYQAWRINELKSGDLDRKLKAGWKSDDCWLGNIH